MAPGAPPNNRVLARLLLAISAGLLLLLHLYEPPAAGLWTQTLFNSMHVPVFGIVALSLYVATGIWANWGLAQRAIGVCIAALALSILSETAQIPGPRDASVKDLISDWLGAAAALLFSLAFSARDAVSRTTRIAFAVVGAAVLLAALSSFITVSVAYLERNFQKPLLVSFDARFGRTFRRTQHATLHVTRDSTSARKVGQITLNDGAWPGVVFHDVWPDWSTYSSLVIEFGLDGDSSLDIQIRVHDRAHKLGDQPYKDRFNMTHELRPGFHVLRVPLEKILNAPQNRQMDLSQIDGIVIFCSPTDTGRSFQLAEIRLE